MNKISVISTSSSEQEVFELTKQIAIAKPVIVVIGSIMKLKENIVVKLVRLFTKGIGRFVCRDGVKGINVVTGGTTCKLLPNNENCLFIGVSPKPLVYKLCYLEPNRHHFFLVEDTTKWGEETPAFFKVVRSLTYLNEKRFPALPCLVSKTPSPAVIILAGGGFGSVSELLLGINYDIPVIAISGTGGVSDHVASLCLDPINHSDPSIARLDNMQIYSFPIDGDPVDFDALLWSVLR